MYDRFEEWEEEFEEGEERGENNIAISNDSSDNQASAIKLINNSIAYKKNYLYGFPNVARILASMKFETSSPLNNVQTYYNTPDRYFNTALPSLSNIQDFCEGNVKRGIKYSIRAYKNSNDTNFWGQIFRKINRRKKFVNKDLKSLKLICSRFMDINSNNYPLTQRRNIKDIPFDTRYFNIPQTDLPQSAYEILRSIEQCEFPGEITHDIMYLNYRKFLEIQKIRRQTKKSREGAKINISSRRNKSNAVNVNGRNNITKRPCYRFQHYNSFEYGYDECFCLRCLTAKLRNSRRDEAAMEHRREAQTVQDNESKARERNEQGINSENVETESAEDKIRKYGPRILETIRRLELEETRNREVANEVSGMFQPSSQVGQATVAPNPSSPPNLPWSPPIYMRQSWRGANPIRKKLATSATSASCRYCLDHPMAIASVGTTTTGVTTTSATTSSATSATTSPTIVTISPANTVEATARAINNTCPAPWIVWLIDFAGAARMKEDYVTIVNECHEHVCQEMLHCRLESLGVLKTSRNRFNYKLMDDKIPRRKPSERTRRISVYSDDDDISIRISVINIMNKVYLNNFQYEMECRRKDSSDMEIKFYEVHWIYMLMDCNYDDLLDID